MRTLALSCLLWGCSPPPDDEVDPTDTAAPTTPPAPTTPTSTDTDEPEGACGEITVWDLTVRGIVHTAEGFGAPFADVWLEDRGWAPTTAVLGSAFTDAEGRFELDVVGLTSVEDCWGTMLDYVLVAEAGSQRGEDGINTYLYTAILDGTLVADVSATPLVMDDAVAP